MYNIKLPPREKISTLLEGVTVVDFNLSANEGSILKFKTHLPIFV
jgi:hypothetical protein